MGGGNRVPIPSNIGKSKSRGKAVFMIQPKESWTHDFCLPSNTEQDKTPSQEWLVTLKEAELSRKRIVLTKKSGPFLILGLLSKIENNPQKFQQFFVHHNGNISADFVKKFTESC